MTCNTAKSLFIDVDSSVRLINVGIRIPTSCACGPYDTAGAILRIRRKGQNSGTEITYYANVSDSERASTFVLDNLFYSQPAGLYTGIISIYNLDCEPRLTLRLKRAGRIDGGYAVKSQPVSIDENPS